MKFYAGATFNYAGTLQLTGPFAGGIYGVTGDQPDFSQFNISAYIYDMSGEILISTLTVTNNSSTAAPSTNGNYQINASADETATWPAGKAQIIFKLIASDGSTILAPPVAIQIIKIPTGPKIS
ncbi:hypothetical protein [Caballeronia zhejiangensis]|uniref:hypothetical protein n=1 Tax=Caballeronia zhejiangensis TaxID=871203 RepID=UPI001F52AE34|nr:hypothetical protein [Caballeronia zhejiangensis]MCI1046955.1 hypothetical protein [Caballeronia zhejiangensis]